MDWFPPGQAVVQIAEGRDREEEEKQEPRHRSIVGESTGVTSCGFHLESGAILGAPPRDGMIGNQHQNCADGRHENAVNIEAGYAMSSEGGE